MSSPSPVGALSPRAGCLLAIPWALHGPALLRLALPIVATALVYQVGTFITLRYVGQIEGASYMGAVALGGMLTNITGYSLSYGMCTALDALISQAYGAGEYRLMGLHTQRAMLILSLFSLPVSVLWAQTEWILHHVLGIDAHVSKLAGQWAIILIVGLWPNLIYEVLKRFLQGQNIVWPAVVSAFARTASVLLFSELAIKYGYGFEGLAIASVLANWVSLFVIVTCMCGRRAWLRCSLRHDHAHLVSYAELATADPELPRHIPPPELSNSKDKNTSALQSVEGDVGEPEHDPENNWPAPSTALFRDWGVFLSLGIPGAASLFLEWGSFELAASIAGHIQPSSTVLAAHGVFMNTAGLMYMMPQAVASATATLAGNLLGANEPDLAAGVIKMGVMFDFQYGVLAGSFLLFFRRHWGGLYTQDSDVQELVSADMFIMFVYSIVDATKCVTLNVLRSIGLPNVTVYVNCLACVFILLPMGWLLAIHLQYGLFGLWAAMSIAWFTATCIFSFIIIRVDWTAQAKIARRRQRGITDEGCGGADQLVELMPMMIAAAVFSDEAGIVMG